MIQRSTLAAIARSEALKCYHGFVMETEPNLDPIVQLFPPWPLREWDGKWCAAFVYYCCRLAGFDLPVRYPDDRVSCNFAGCLAWEQWAMLPETGFYHRTGEERFMPEAGDIVLYDGVFDPGPHDHIGVVLENREASLLVAEGNFNNVSAVLERKKDGHIRAYIRIPEGHFSTQRLKINDILNAILSFGMVMIPMYCPFCRQEMNKEEDGYHCPSGSLFSIRVSEYFDDESVSKMAEIKTRNDNPDGSFFCVHCGTKMKRIDDYEEQCCACGFYLQKSILFQLLELNPHH